MKDCPHKRAQFHGFQNTLNPKVKLVLANCLNKDCLSTVSWGWYVNGKWQAEYKEIEDDKK